MDSVQFEAITIAHRTRAIVCFGPATTVTGMRSGDYFQVVIDPAFQSPAGGYLRFDGRIDENEIHGWQRIDALTVCEILEQLEESKENIIMRAILRE